MSITLEKILSYEKEKLIEELDDKKFHSNKTVNEIFILFAKKSLKNNTLVVFQRKIVENKNFEKEFKKQKKTNRRNYLLSNLYNINESYDLEDIFYLKEDILDQLYEFWFQGNLLGNDFLGNNLKKYKNLHIFEKKDLFVKLFKYPSKNEQLIDEKYQKYIQDHNFLPNLYYNKNFDDFLNFFSLAKNKEDSYKFIYGEKNFKKVLKDTKYQFNDFYYFDNDLFLNILRKIIKTLGMDFFEFIKLHREYFFLFLNNSIYNNSVNKNLIGYKNFKKLMKIFVVNEDNYFFLELLDFIRFLFSEKKDDTTDEIISEDIDMIFLQRIKKIFKVDINHEILIDFILSFIITNTNYITNLEILDLTEEDFINITKFISSNFFKSKRDVTKKQAKLIFDKIKNNKNLKYFNLLSYKNFNLDDKINILSQLKLYEKFDHLKHKSLAFLYFRSLTYPKKIRNDVMEDIIASFIFKINKDEILKDYIGHNRVIMLNYSKYDPQFLEKIIKYILISFSLRFPQFNNMQFLYILNTIYTFKDFDSLMKFIKQFLIAQNINNNIYTQGVNVHDEQRDQKTENAIFELYQTWNPNEKKIEKYFKKFEKYIEKLDLSENKKNDLDRVIYGKDRKTTDFGGFLTSCTIINGKRVEGKELIARFWRFILKYKEDENLSEKDNLKQNTSKKISKQLSDTETEKEIENLKHGFIMALLSSVNNQGNVVCDPGKKQRMVVAVLQNRLKANGKFIKIDDYFEDKEDKTQAKEIEMIKDFNLIHKYLTPFVNYYMYEKETRIININDFFNKLFKYIIDISENGSQNFGKVDLHVYYVVYYCVMLTMTEDGLIINPNLSLCSNFEDMYDISNYLNIFLKKEEDEFDLQFPEIKEKRIKKLENQERLKNISEKMKERAKKERYRLEYKEKHGKSPEG